LATARTISRFGRTYTEFDPDGGGGGPPTWVLATPGAGSGSASSGASSGIFTPSTPTSTIAKAGMAVYMPSPGNLDLAQATDASVAGTIHPYLVAGLAAADTTVGQSVNVLTDGQLSLSDWTLITGEATLRINQRYYLSDLMPGTMTFICPTRLGSTVVCLGQAVSQLTFEIEINLMVHL
jgi:hypothetical protein